MSETLRDRVAAVLARIYEPKCCDECDQHRDSVLASFYLEDADKVIEALDRDYIIVEPGTPLAQRIAQWQLANCEQPDE